MRVVVAGLAPVVASTFVPGCIVEQCEAEGKALASDGYTGAIGTCAVENFGPCADKAWECLGDHACRQVVTCAPKVVEKCGQDIWEMMTNPDEREKLMCIEKCIKPGSSIPDPLCVAAKCGTAAVECLADKTCRDAAVCLPEALLSCSLPAFNCVLGLDGVCRQNIECLAHGVSRCADPAVNLFTDAKIADLIRCAGDKCPHPRTGNETVVAANDVAEGKAVEMQADVDSPSVDDPALQLLCVAAKCGGKVAKIVADEDTKDLIGCALRQEIRNECSTVWDCLGDQACSDALSCWAAPFSTCKDDVWSMFVDQYERKLIEDGASCLQSCQQAHPDDFTEATFCVMDNCADGLLTCWKDNQCRAAVKCLPETAGQCALPQVDAYVHQELFQKTIKCLGHGLESCGRGAVEMLRDQNIAEAISCAAQCTHAPRVPSSLVI